MLPGFLGKQQDKLRVCPGLCGSRHWRVRDRSFAAIIRFMDGEQHPTRVALREARENTIEELSGGFARDEISLDEFEKRVDRAYAAASAIELHELVRDLSAAQAPAAAEQAHGKARAIVQAPSSPLTRRIPWAALAIFGNVERRGQLLPHSQNRVMALFGNVELDLRSVVLPEGETELHVEAVFGNVEITLPPTLAVVCDGWSVFGSFQSVSRVPARPDGTAVLRITGRSIFGNVEFHTRPQAAEGTSVRVIELRDDPK